MPRNERSNKQTQKLGLAINYPIFFGLFMYIDVRLSVDVFGVKSTILKLVQTSHEMQCLCGK